MLHSAVGILLQFKKKDVEQEEKEEETGVRVVRPLSVSYSIIFNTHKPPETTNCY